MGLVKRYVSSARSFSRDLTLRLLPSYPQLVGVRACLGIAESGLGCGVFYQCVSEPSYYPVQVRSKTLFLCQLQPVVSAAHAPNSDRPYIRRSDLCRRILRPTRVWYLFHVRNGRLAWLVMDIRALLQSSHFTADQSDTP